MPKVSIIVPVYNTEKGLSKCLNSLVSQEEKDIEIIIINDGSLDNSEKIINEFMSKHKNIIYYKKQNTGIADTRNFGISKAVGEYIFFVDSDDYIDTKLIKTLNQYMEQKIDIIKFKLTRVDETGKEIKQVGGPVFEETSGYDAFNKLYCEDILLDSPCVYLFKREFIIQNNFRFKVNTYHEDFGLIPLVVMKCESIVSLNIYGYFYVQSENSITRTMDYSKTLKKADDCLIHYDAMLEQIKSYNIPKLAQENIKIYYTNSIILKLNELKKEDRNKYIKEIKKRKMSTNIKVRNLKQFIKRILLNINVNLYLKIR